MFPVKTSSMSIDGKVGSRRSEAVNNNATSTSISSSHSTSRRIHTSTAAAVTSSLSPEATSKFARRRQSSVVNSGLEPGDNKAPSPGRDVNDRLDHQSNRQNYRTGNQGADSVDTAADCRSDHQKPTSKSRRRRTSRTSIGGDDLRDDSDMLFRCYFPPTLLQRTVSTPVDYEGDDGGGDCAHADVYQRRQRHERRRTSTDGDLVSPSTGGGRRVGSGGAAGRHRRSTTGSRVTTGSRRSSTTRSSSSATSSGSTFDRMYMTSAMIDEFRLGERLSVVL